MIDEESALTDEAAESGRRSPESHLVRAWARVPLRDRALQGREDQLAVVRDAQTVAEPAPAAAPVPALDPPTPHQLRVARAQGEESLRECREALGPDHPDTLASAATLAAVLRAAGDLRAAHDLNEDTLDRLRQVLGPNHPDTLAVAHALAGDRSLLGDFDAAQELYGDTHGRLRALRRARSRPEFICGTSLLLDGSRADAAVSKPGGGRLPDLDL